MQNTELFSPEVIQTNAQIIWKQNKSINRLKKNENIYETLYM